MRKLLFTFAAAAMVLGATGCDKLRELTGTSSSSSSSTDPAKSVEEGAVSATDLSKAYKDDEDGAGKKYDGKPIKVKGKYVGVEPVLLRPKLEGVTGGRFLACEFDNADAPVTKTFENGQNLVFSCTVVGAQANDYIALQHCKML